MVSYFVDFGKYAGLHLLYRPRSGDWGVEPVLKTNQPVDYRLAMSPAGQVTGLAQLPCHREMVLCDYKLSSAVLR